MNKPIVPEIPPALRRSINEWVSKGCAVRVNPDGSLEITPVLVKGPDISRLDLVDFRR